MPTSGPVCSKIVGSKQGSIVHILWKEYSPDIAVDFLSECQQITNRWLPHYGFSFGLSDCMLKEGFDISEKIKETKESRRKRREKENIECYGLARVYTLMQH